MWRLSHLNDEMRHDCSDSLKNIRYVPDLEPHKKVTWVCAVQTVIKTSDMGHKWAKKLDLGHCCLQCERSLRTHLCSTLNTRTDGAFCPIHFTEGIIRILLSKSMAWRSLDCISVLLHPGRVASPSQSVIYEVRCRLSVLIHGYLDPNWNYSHHSVTGWLI